MKKIIFFIALLAVALAGRGQSDDQKRKVSKNVIYGGITGNPDGSIKTGFTFGFEGFYYGKSKNPFNIDMGVAYVPDNLIIYGLGGVRFKEASDKFALYFAPKAGIGFILADNSSPGLELAATIGAVIYRYINFGVKDLISFHTKSGNWTSLNELQIVLGLEF